MIYHPDLDIVIYTPARCGGLSLFQALATYGWIATNHLPASSSPICCLLMRHPINRIKSLYKVYNSRPSQIHRMPFKIWLKAKPPAPQYIECPKPQLVFQLENLKSDLQEAGIIHDPIEQLNQSVPQNIEPCLASRAFIRSRYKEDFELGEYE